MSFYYAIKTLHIISATILFGTGLGTAFFMFRSRYTEALPERHYAIRNTVLADYIFTAPAGVIQLATGLWLVWAGGFGWLDGWLVATYALFVVAGACWLPVVWIQIRLKRMLADCLATASPLPDEYHRLFRIWVVLGVPAFLGLIVVFFLMVLKPV